MLLINQNKIEESIYYTASFIIKELKAENHQDFLNLYQKLKTGYKMSFATYILSLDWLYLIEVATIDSKGGVNLCS